MNKVIKKEILRIKKTGKPSDEFQIVKMDELLYLAEKDFIFNYDDYMEIVSEGQNPAAFADDNPEDYGFQQLDEGLYFCEDSANYPLIELKFLNSVAKKIHKLKQKEYEKLVEWTKNVEKYSQNKKVNQMWKLKEKQKQLTIFLVMFNDWKSGVELDLIEKKLQILESGI